MAPHLRHSVRVILRRSHLRALTALRSNASHICPYPAGRRANSAGEHPACRLKAVVKALAD